MRDIIRVGPYCAVLTLACFSDGQTLLFQHALTAPDSYESSTAMAADGTSVYVAGVYRPASQYSSGYDTDAFLRKYDSTGAQVWARQFGGPLWPAAIATTKGAIFVTGHTSWNFAAQMYFTLPGQTGSGFGDAFVRRYDSDGNVVWTREFSGEAGDTANAIAADATAVYVMGAFGTFGPSQPFLRKYDLDGNELWTQKLSAALAVAVDDTGGYIIGAIAPPTGSNQFTGILSKLDFSGSLLWTHQLNANEFPTSVVASTGAIYVSGRFQLLASKSFIRRYDAAGNEMWTAELPAGSVNRIAASATGIYAAGTTNYTLPGQCAAGSSDVYVKGYDPNGQDLGTHQFGSYDVDMANQIAIDNESIYVSGARTTNEYYPISSRVFLAKLVAEPSPSLTIPRIRQECVLNSANYVGGAVAPTEIVTILGSAIGPAEPALYTVNKDGQIPTTLAGTQILFNNVAAPLLSVSAEQATAIVPSAIADLASVDVHIEYKGVSSPAITLPVPPSRPGAFSLDKTGTGQAAALNEDGSVNSPSNPAARGSIVVFYFTGGGQNAVLSPDNQVQTNPPVPLKGQVSVVMTYPPYFDLDDGAYVDILYAGGVPGSDEGLTQINVRPPAEGSYAPPAGPWAPQVFVGTPSWGGVGAIVSQSLATISVR